MDHHQLQNGAAFSQSMPSLIELRQQPVDHRIPANHSLTKSSSKAEGEVMDSVTARRTQKADREKLRREKLNEQFLVLGNVLDPDRPKNDKATILNDTVQLLKDLTSEVNKLKAEYTTLTEESHELTQEKNDLREEKASLKSDIENLNIQYQQRLRAMPPWAAMDHTVMMAPPPSYPYPMAMAMPHGSIPMHPSIQPYPFFGNQNPGVIPTYMPFVAPNTVVEQQSVHVPQNLHQGNRSRDSGSKVSRESKTEKAEDSNDVATELELKTPGSISDKDLLSGERKSRKSSKKESSSKEGSSTSMCSSSSPSERDRSSNSRVGGRNSDDIVGENN